MDHAQLIQWVEGYKRAWRTPGTDSLAELFTEDATYSTAPYEKPYHGLEAIGEMWEAERLGPDYRAPKDKEYRDLWIVRLNESGLCFHFEEWPFWPPGQKGAPATGAV